MSSLMFLHSFRQDVLHSLRMMGRNPGSTATALVTLAFGIGANTAVFSIVEAVLFRPLPYKDSSRLVAIWDRNVHANGVSKFFDSFEDFQEFERHTHTLEDVSAATWAVGGRLLSGHGPTRQVLAIPVSESFFRLLGVPAARGRTFASDDRKLGCAVVLSDRLWRGPLASDGGIVSKRVTLDGQPCAVVGVMPPGFAFYPEAAQLWMLITPGFTPSASQFAPAANPLIVGIFARLKPGVTPAQAQEEVAALHSALHRTDGKERDLAPAVYELRGEFTFLAEAALRTTLLVLLGAVICVLLIACLNVASLQLAQTFGRERELAVRAALGCGRGRLVRQLLTESLLVACLGGAMGVGVAWSAIRYFRAVHPIEMPVGTEIEMNWELLAFTGAVSILTAILFGLLPAWKASRHDILESLKSASRASTPAAPQRLNQILIAAEVALSLLLLAGAGLLAQSVWKMGSEPLGFRPAGLELTDITLPVGEYAGAPRRLQFYEQLETKMGDNAALATGLPPYGTGAVSELHVMGRATSVAERLDVGLQTVSRQYFEVLGIRLLQGRAFDGHDRSSSEPVAMVNEALAQEYFPSTDPIGQRIRVGDPSDQNPWRVIVGVVASDKRSPAYHQVGWQEPSTVFKPLEQDPPPAVSVATRGTSAAVRRAVTEIDNAVAVGESEAMETRLDRFLAYPRFRAILLGAFAIFSLALSGIGLHGVLRQFVAERTPELGIRMALGARQEDVLRLIAWEGGRPVLAGIALGTAGAAALARYLNSVLYGVRAGDPLTFGAVVATLLLVGAMAAFLPARRAARIDPMVALRHE